MSDTSNSAILEAPPAGRLVGQRADAIRLLQNQIERGAAIRAMRIRSAQELDQARSAKLEWTMRSTQLLTDLFGNSSVADQCNDWVGRIYPEYAEFGNFVETFYAEMDHRLRRLKVVLRRLERPEPQPMAEQRIGGKAPASAGQEIAATVKIVSEQPHSHSSEVRALLVVGAAADGAAESVRSFLDSLGMQVSMADGTTAMAEALEKNPETGFALFLNDRPASEQAFELGYSAGRLGLNRVMLLNTQAGESPDKRGVVHLIMDGTGGWMLQLARHLKRAGLNVDLNRLC